MDFRAGSLEDVKEIVSLIKGAIKEMESFQIYQWDEIYPTEEDFISDIKNETLYLAIENGKIAAIYVISTECDDAYNNCKWNFEKACILHRLCVSKEFQHKGVGKQVLLHIEQQLKSLGYESVRLDVFSQNPFSLKLYTKNGYTIQGYADWRKGRFYLMEKSLI